MIPITWPFVVWGLDLVGPLKKVPGGYTHLLVTIDKFTKWIEAQPISAIKFEQAVLFFLDIVHCFGVLNSIIIDNGTQFTEKSSFNSTMNATSGSIGPPSRTPERMGRSSAQTAWSYRASSPGSSTG